MQGPRPCHLHSDSWFKNLRILLFPPNCHLACVVTGSHSIVFRFLSWRSPSGSRRCGWSSCRGESWGRVAGRGARRVGRPGVSRFKSACLPRSPGGVFLAWWVLGQAPLLTTSLRLHWCGLRLPPGGTCAPRLHSWHPHPRPRLPGSSHLPQWCVCFWLCLGDRGRLSTPHTSTQLVSRGHLEAGTSVLLELGPAAGPAQQTSRERPLCSCGEGDGTPLQYSCLENPMDGGAWWAAVCGVAQSQT